MFTTYLRVLRVPHVGALFVLGMLASLPLGMAGLALLLNTEERTGSIVVAGLVSAAFGLGNAVGIAGQGRLMDRLGHAQVLLPASVLSFLGLLAAAFLSSTTALLVVAAVAGIAYPATISSVRVLSAAYVEDADTRRAAYALLAVSFGLVMVAGPLLVSGIVALAGPAQAVVVTAIVIGISGVAFSATHAVRTHQPANAAAGQSRLGFHRGFLTIVVANAALGFAAGAKGVAIPAVAIAHGVPALAGIGFAAMSIGDLVGGLGYGVVRWRATMPRQLAVSMLLTAVVACVAVPAAGSVTALLPVLLATGVLGACVPICMSALLDEVVPRASLTTAYTTMVSLGLLASAAGNAVGGAVIEQTGPGGGFGLAAGAASLAAAWAIARRARWSPTGTYGHARETNPPSGNRN